MNELIVITWFLKIAIYPLLKGCKIQLELPNIKILTKEKLFFLLSESIVTTLVSVGIHVEIFKGCR